MHELALGVGPVAFANALLELTEHDAFGKFVGDWKTRTTAQLRIAHVLFKKYCKGAGLAHSQQRFTLPLLSMSSKDCWPCLKAKAHNCMMCICWMSSLLNHEHTHDHVAIPPRDTSDWTHSRACILYSFAMVWKIIRGKHHAAPPLLQPSVLVWLSDKDASMLGRLARILHEKWHWLSAACLASGKCRWQQKPKHHALQHSLEYAARTKRNPASHYVFIDESFIGRTKRTIQECHPSTASLRCLVRSHLHWAVKINSQAWPHEIFRRGQHACAANLS